MQYKNIKVAGIFLYFQLDNKNLANITEKNCSIQCLEMCRARKVVNFAKPCLPTWLILSISSWLGNGRWLELSWNHVFKFQRFNYTQNLFRPIYVTFAKYRCYVCKKNNRQLNTVYHLFPLSLVFDLDILGKIEAMPFHQFTVSTIANETPLASPDHCKCYFLSQLQTWHNFVQLQNII